MLLRHLCPFLPVFPFPPHIHLDIRSEQQPEFLDRCLFFCCLDLCPFLHSLNLPLENSGILSETTSNFTKNKYTPGL